MKKLLGAVLALMLLVGCSNSNKVDLSKMNAEEQYRTAVDVMQKVKSMEADMQMDITLSMLGEEIKQSQNLVMKISDVTDLTKMKAEMILSSEEVEMTMYMNEGYMYMNLSGVKVKAKLDEAALNTSVNQVELEQFDASKMFNITTTTSGKDIIISYEMSEEAINEIVEQQLSALLAQYPEASFTFDKSNVSITMNEKAEIKQMIMSLGMSLTAEGQTLVMTLEMTVDYKNINNTKVTLPNDLDTYKEY